MPKRKKRGKRNKAKRASKDTPEAQEIPPTAPDPQSPPVAATVAPPASPVDAESAPFAVVDPTFADLEASLFEAFEDTEIEIELEPDAPEPDEPLVALATPAEVAQFAQEESAMLTSRDFPLPGSSFDPKVEKPEGPPIKNTTPPLPLKERHYRGDQLGPQTRKVFSKKNLTERESSINLDDGRTYIAEFRYQDGYANPVAYVPQVVLEQLQQGASALKKYTFV